MPEWLKGTDCKSVGFTFTGSNPVRPIYWKGGRVVEYTGFENRLSEN